MEDIERQSRRDDDLTNSGIFQLEKEVGVDTYFANPHNSWEKGINENTTGLLRRDIFLHLI
jgi:IS30 family transposase